MILHVGMPRAASTAIEQFMAMQVKIGHADINELIWNRKAIDGAHYVRAESVVDGVRIFNEKEWQHWLYRPGAWAKVVGSSVARVDLKDNVESLKDVYPDAKILIVRRDAKSFIRSVYRYAVHQMPWGRRSFMHYLATPSGLTHQLIGDGAEAVWTFNRIFGEDRVRSISYGTLVTNPQTFMAQLCKFCDVKPGPLPVINASYGGLTLLAKRVLP